MRSQVRPTKLIPTVPSRDRRSLNRSGVAMNASKTSLRHAVRIAHRFADTTVNVEIGNGAIAPKVALKRAAAPVKVEIGNGAIAPKVAQQRMARCGQR